MSVARRLPLAAGAYRGGQDFFIRIAQGLDNRDVLTVFQQFYPAVTVFTAAGRIIFLPDVTQPTVAQERFFQFNPSLRDFDYPITTRFVSYISFLKSPTCA